MKAKQRKLLQRFLKALLTPAAGAFFDIAQTCIKPFPSFRVNFHAREELGITVCNPAAISKVKFY